MTSILTNTSAMNALQTLKSTNMNLNKTQQEIASGKSIASARDNAAVWAISKVMDSDVKGFEQISNSLALGQSTIAVARNAAESVTDLLTDIKGLVVSAQEQNVDRVKIQEDITRLTEQVESIVSSAQFNGLNLVNGTASSPVSILSSLNRAADGTVTSANIEIALDDADLSMNAGTALNASALPTAETAIEAGGTAATIAATDFDFYTANFAAATGTVALDSADFTSGTEGDTGLLAGDRVEMTFGSRAVAYTVREGDTGAAILAGLTNALQNSGVDEDVSVVFDGATLTVTNNLPADGNANDIAVSFEATRGAGGLSALSSMTVTDNTSADQALIDVENMIQYAISAAAGLGSAEKRIDIQADFVSKLTDSFKAGISTLVDADMEEASARLQALQVQQQLGVQALSIANQSPQALLSLFR